MTDAAIASLAAGVALVAGVDLRRIVVLTAAMALPLIAGVLVAFLILRQRRAVENRAVMLTEGIASELRAGANLRDALAVSAGAVGLETSGGTVGAIASEIAVHVPEIGTELRSAVAAAVSSGSRVADLFDEIGAIAIAQAEVSREVRVATAPARVTAAVLGGAPALYLILQMRGSGLTSLVSSPGQKVSGLLGLALFLAGLATVLTILWRAA